MYVGNASTFSGTLQIGTGISGGIFQTLSGGTSFSLYSANLVPSAQNYALAYNGASLNLNAPTGGGIYSSINNSIVSTLASTGLTVNVTTVSTSTSTGALQVRGGIGVSDSVYVGNKVGFVNTAGNTSVVYQFYNTATNSLDTVFG